MAGSSGRARGWARRLRVPAWGQRPAPAFAVDVRTPGLPDAPAVEPERAIPLPGRRDHARTIVWAMAGVWAAVLAWLSVARHDAFATGRFDLGNMVQAVWSTAHG